MDKIERKLREALRKTIILQEESAKEEVELYLKNSGTEKEEKMLDEYDRVLWMIVDATNLLSDALLLYEKMRRER